MRVGYLLIVLPFLLAGCGGSGNDDGTGESKCANVTIKGGGGNDNISIGDIVLECNNEEGDGDLNQTADPAFALPVGQLEFEPAAIETRDFCDQADLSPNTRSENCESEGGN